MRFRLQPQETLSSELPFIPHIRNEKIGTFDSAFFQSGFSVSLEPSEMLVVFHSLPPSFVMVINYPRGHSRFSKERPLSWEAPQSQANRNSSHRGVLIYRAAVVVELSKVYV